MEDSVSARVSPELTEQGELRLTSNLVNIQTDSIIQDVSHIYL